MNTLPKLEFRKIKQRERLKYYKNLDVNLHDSYIDLDNEKIYIEFPVQNKKIDLLGLHYHNFELCQILVLQISEKNGDTLRDKIKNKIAYLEFNESNLTNIDGVFDISNIEKLHVIVYNDDTVYPEYAFNKELKSTRAIPKEGNGGGVIIVGP